MRICVLWAGLLVGLTFLPADALRAGEKKTWQEADLAKLQGQWITSRQRDTAKESARRYELMLQFKGSKLKLFVFEQSGSKSPGDELTLVRIEQAEGARRMILSFGEGKGSESVVYYAFEGEKLILVGNCPMRRPLEGASLSGEYKRTEKAK